MSGFLTPSPHITGRSLDVVTTTLRESLTPSQLIWRHSERCDVRMRVNIPPGVIRPISLTFRPCKMWRL